MYLLVDACLSMPVVKDMHYKMGILRPRAGVI